MGGAEWLQLGAAALSGSALPWVARFVHGRLFRDRKQEAETRKINAEADDKIALRLYREIERLDNEMNELRAELGKVKAEALDEKRSLERENRSLKSEVDRLKRRVAGLESILKVTPLPADMKEMLAEIDRKTGKRSGQ